MERRNIPRSILETVLNSPEQILESGEKRKVYQSRIDFSGKLYLVRVIMEPDDPAIVVTVYRTSKVEKYWSKS